ncbi:MAG: hypothetical protein U0930_22105 [Pirellulales bacterium]
MNQQQSSGIPTFVFVLIAALLGLFGIMFFFAAGQGNALVRLIIGSGCIMAALAMMHLAKMRPIQETHIHKMELDLPGKVDLKNTECKSCGATLDSGAVKVVGGVVQVSCPYCGTSYELEEAPKW